MYGDGGSVLLLQFSCRQLSRCIVVRAECLKRKELHDVDGRVASVDAELDGNAFDVSEAITVPDNAKMFLGTLYTSMYATNPADGIGLWACTDLLPF